MNKIEIGIGLLNMLTWLCFGFNVKTGSVRPVLICHKNFNQNPESLLRRV